MYIIIGGLYNVWCYAHYPKLASTVIIIRGGVMWPAKRIFSGEVGTGGWGVGSKTPFGVRPRVSVGRSRSRGSSYSDTVWLSFNAYCL